MEEKVLNMNLEGLLKTGMVKYFYHSPSSTLPIRDVLGEHNDKNSCKTEPHIEICSENFLKKCYQNNIKKFAEGTERYLFLVTKCRNKKLEQYDNQYIIGCIEKEEIIDRETHICIKGATYIYSFQDSILVRDVFEWPSFDRIKLAHEAYVDEKKTKLILEHFNNTENIILGCIEEIKRLDSENKTCIGKELCDHSEYCLRMEIT